MIWSCLDDGADKDNLSDASVKVMSLNDLTAESTGGVFDATGKHYFVSIPAQRHRPRRDTGNQRLAISISKGTGCAHC